MNRQTLCVDFDGVIHRYSKGWQDGRLYDDITPGFFEWALEVRKSFNIAIFSTRSRTPGGRAAMKRWLQAQWRKSGRGGHMPDFQFPAFKPPSWLSIDDRCIRFDGRWEWLRAEVLQSFRPWNSKENSNESAPPDDDTFLPGARDWGRQGADPGPGLGSRRLQASQRRSDPNGGSGGDPARGARSLGSAEAS